MCMCVVIIQLFRLPYVNKRIVDTSTIVRCQTSNHYLECMSSFFHTETPTKLHLVHTQISSHPTPKPDNTVRHVMRHICSLILDYVVSVQKLLDCHIPEI